MDKYDTLIELVDKHNEIADATLTHIKRGSRISMELSSHLLEMSKAFQRNYKYLPPNELRDIGEIAGEIAKLNDEFVEFFGDYAKDLEKVGNSIMSIFEELQKCV